MLALAEGKEPRVPFFSWSAECDVGPCHPRMVSEIKSENNVRCSPDQTLRAREISVRRPVGHGLCAMHGVVYLTVHGRHTFLQSQDQSHHRLGRNSLYLVCTHAHGAKGSHQVSSPITLHLNFFFGSTCPYLPRAGHTGVIQVAQLLRGP